MRLGMAREHLRRPFPRTRTTSSYRLLCPFAKEIVESLATRRDDGTIGIQGLDALQALCLILTRDELGDSRVAQEGRKGSPNAILSDGIERSVKPVRALLGVSLDQ